MPKGNYIILSIDGGGIRGIIAARLIEEIEKRAKKKSHELFDLIAGTSTGGILALGLTKPVPKSAEEMLGFYNREAKNIFVPEERNWQSKVIQNTAGVGTALFERLIIEHLFNMKTGVSFRSNLVDAIKVPEFLTLMGKGMLLVGCIGSGFQAGLGNLTIGTLIGAFLRGGILSGILFNVIDVAERNLLSMDMLKMLVLTFSYAAGVGLTHSFMKKESFTLGHLVKRVGQDIPASMVGGLMLGLIGTNFKFSQTFKYSALGFIGALATSYIFSGFMPYLFPRYTRKGIDSVLEKNFKHTVEQEEVDAILGDALTNVFITSYNIGERGTVFFTNYDESHRNLKMSDVAGASSSAPTYFPPKTINIKDGINKTYIDGGLTANNPSFAAYAHAKKLGYSDNEIYIISIGTGDNRPGLSSSEVRSRGTLGWIKDVVEIENESAILVHSLMEDVLPEGHYQRFQVNLPESIELDEVSVDVLEKLIGYADRYVSDSSKVIDKTVMMLNKVRSSEHSQEIEEINSSKAEVLEPSSDDNASPQVLTGKYSKSKLLGSFGLSAVKNTQSPTTHIANTPAPTNSWNWIHYTGGLIGLGAVVYGLYCYLNGNNSTDSTSNFSPTLRR